MVSVFFSGAARDLKLLEADGHVQTQTPTGTEETTAPPVTDPVGSITRAELRRVRALSMAHCAQLHARPSRHVDAIRDPDRKTALCSRITNKLGLDISRNQTRGDAKGFGEV